MIKFLSCVGLIVAGAVYTQAPQERQYTITVPAHLANPLWLLLNGQKDKVTLAQFQELTPLVAGQFEIQDTQFAREDSIVAANARKNASHPDTTKTKKP